MAAEEVTEQIAEHLEEAANATRQIDSRIVGAFTSGAIFGIAIGLVFGYRYNKEKIKAEAFKESEAAIAEMREYYNSKIVALQAQDKKNVEEIVEERGYSTKEGPMDVVDMEAVAKLRPLRPVVPVTEPPHHVVEAPHLSTRHAMRSLEGQKDKNEGWSYPHELSQRKPGVPYIIHQDEYSAGESGYQQVSYTYWAKDDILTDEDETVIENRDNLIGENNLRRMGHGSDDINIVYVRNSQLELEFEICRHEGSYEEVVLGLENDSAP